MSCPIVICLLGDFRLLLRGQPLLVNGNSKAELLLRFLALRSGLSAQRETLLDLLWPDNDLALATQSLSSLIYSLRKQLSGALSGAPPLLAEGGVYRLNLEAGIGIDVDQFHALTERGEQLLLAGNWDPAVPLFHQALDLYRGDLLAGSDTSALIRREHARASYLAILNHLADYALLCQDYQACLAYTRRLLEQDPCRETAHRLAMLCYVQRGERATALRQFQLCRHLLDSEFHAEPEPATVELFEQIRLRPGSLNL